MKKSALISSLVAAAIATAAVASAAEIKTVSLIEDPVDPSALAVCAQLSSAPKWWHGKVAYQIYPRSFKDSNGDGIGDLRGITSKLDHLKALGIDIIWLSPIYASPMVDNGYDISDYRAINPEFGTMKDFDEMLSEMKKRGMHLIMDLVVNHCSSEHAAFKKALADPEGPEAKYFYFRKGKNGLPPDNLRSYFGGSVWEKVPGHENYYYLHYFAKQQPDLNWYNPDLRERVYDMVNFWLDKGVDGFRIDAIMNVAKDTAFPGLPPDAVGDGMAEAKVMTAMHAAEVPGILKEFRDRCIKPHDALTVGEAFGLNDEILPEIYGSDGIFSSVFDFTVREIFENAKGYYDYPMGSVKMYRDANFKGQLDAQKTGFASPITENHDEPRAVSLYLPPKLQNAQGARALAVAFMFMRGLPFIYEGQEIGMTNTDFKSKDEFRDLVAAEEYTKALDHGLSPQEALKTVALQSRDNARTPMLWDDTMNAGFTTGTPWIRMHQDFKTLNVKAQEQDPTSVLNCYRDLIKLRKDPRFAEIMIYGLFIPMQSSDDEVLAYKRKLSAGEITVISNLSLHDTQFDLKGKILYQTGKAEFKDGKLLLGSGSAVVLKP